MQAVVSNNENACLLWNDPLLSYSVNPAENELK